MNTFIGFIFLFSFIGIFVSLIYLIYVRIRHGKGSVKVFTCIPIFCCFALTVITFNLYEPPNTNIDTTAHEQIEQTNEEQEQSEQQDIEEPKEVEEKPATQDTNTVNENADTANTSTQSTESNVAPVPQTPPAQQVAPAQHTTAPAITYIASAQSDKFHKPRCRAAKKINSENAIYFGSREEAINAGYSPCGICKP